MSEEDRENAAAQWQPRSADYGLASRFWYLLRGSLQLLDASYALWLLLSAFAAVFAIDALLPVSVFPIAQRSGSTTVLLYNDNWPLLALCLFCMFCSFTALCYWGHNNLTQVQRGQENPCGPPCWGLLLPLGALCYLLSRAKLHQNILPRFRSGAKLPNVREAQETQKAEKQVSSNTALRGACLLAIALLLQLALLFWAAGNWRNLGQGINRALNRAISQPVERQLQESEHGLADGTQEPASENHYLARLIHRVDIWFLSLKGISAALAIAESSTVEVGAFVYGSVSIGKIVAPLRNLLQRISDILFYGRLVLTAVQIVQSIGQNYGVTLLLALFVLAALEYLLRLLQVALRCALADDEAAVVSTASSTGAKEYSLLPKLLQPASLSAFLRFHLLLLLFLSWCFEPGLQWLDSLLERAILPQELSQSGQVLQELQQNYNDLDLDRQSQNTRSTWSRLLSSVQQWLQNLKTQLQDLSQKLLYFTIMAVIRTIVLPFFVLFALFLLYKLLLSQLLVWDK